jgi:hypothetical protein
MKPAPSRFYGNDHFSLGVCIFNIAHGFGGLTQRITPIDERNDFAGFQKLSQSN